MAKQGRPPKTRAQRRKEGGPSDKTGAISHRRLPAPIVVAGRNVPVAPPDDLEPEAKALWEEIVRQLAEGGIIDRIDLPMLRLLCVEYGRARQAAHLLDEPVSDDELQQLDTTIRENEVVSSALKTQILGAIRIGIEVPPAKVSALAKLETTIANLRAYRLARSRVGNLVALGSTGQLAEHPLASTARQSASFVLRGMTEFAATPLARTRMGLQLMEARTLEKELRDDLGD